MSVVVETIVIELDNLAREYTVTTNRGSLSEVLGTIKVQDDGLFYAKAKFYKDPVLWQNFTRALAYIISPRGMT